MYLMGKKLKINKTGTSSVLMCCKEIFDSGKPNLQKHIYDVNPMVKLRRSFS